ncbi:unnamed protein product [Camellia sinensis]
MMNSLIIILFLSILICLLSLTTTKASPNYLYTQCPNTRTYTPNSTYQSNLNTLFSVLASKCTTSNGFYNFTAGLNPPDIAYGLFLCRGDVSTIICQDCVATAIKEVVQNCPNSKAVTIWYDECMLRYSNKSIFSISDQSSRLIFVNTENINDPKRFTNLLGKVMDDVATRASNGVSGKKFATREAGFSALQKLYGLAQCTPDLTTFDCNSCLRDAISSFPHCCDERRGGRVLFPSCNIRTPLKLDLLPAEARISSKEHKERVVRGEPHALVDVRPAHHFKIASLPNSMNVPLSSLEARLPEIPSALKTEEEHASAASLYVVCRRGNDSQRAVDYLHKMGFTSAKDIIGGL